MKLLVGGLAFIFLALATCSSAQVIGVGTPMSDVRLDEEDAIVPARIMHNSEQIWNGNSLEQNYNYLVYEFETDEHLYEARAYLDDIRTVSILGRYDRARRAQREILTSEQVDPRILAYLRRRYRVIKILGPTGYTPIE
jgi:hypothetical protein